MNLRVIEVLTIEPLVQYTLKPSRCGSVSSCSTTISSSVQYQELVGNVRDGSRRLADEFQVRVRRHKRVCNIILRGYGKMEKADMGGQQGAALLIWRMRSCCVDLLKERDTNARSALVCLLSVFGAEETLGTALTNTVSP